MGYRKEYLRISYKRAGSAFLKILAGFLVSALAVGICIAGADAFFRQSSAFVQVRVSLVIPENETHIRPVMPLLNSVDSVRQVCTFTYDTEAEARRKLRNDEIQAAIIFPENFYQDITQGANTPATVLLPGASSLNTSVFRELLNDGISLIDTTEGSIYAAEDPAFIGQAKLSRKEIEDLVFSLLLKKALNRDAVFDKTVLSPTGSVNLSQYYLAAAFVTVLFFMGLNFTFLYRKEDAPIEQKLRVCGIGPVWRGISKILVMTSVLYAIALLLYGSACGLSAAGLLTSLSFTFGRCMILLLVSLALASFFHFIYSFGASPAHTGMLLLIIGFFMVLSGGCILPSVYLPPFLLKAGQFMPLTFLRACVSDAFFSGTDMGRTALIFMGSAVFACAGMLLAKAGEMRR